MEVIRMMKFEEFCEKNRNIIITEMYVTRKT